jgi:UDP-GlcNAc:undecaprenyl-phosphate/decaprenyl-phosphate GlcNAc-1-phosphate transferase
MSTHAVRSALVAAAAARLSYAALTARAPGGRKAWDRTNHRGEPITLLEGPAVAIGSIAGAVAGGGATRERIALAVAGAGAAAFGSYDDLTGNGVRKGFRGHLGALRAGELTTGAVKIAGIGATGLAAALIAGPSAAGARAAGTAVDGTAAGRGLPAPLAVADTLINAGLVAGGANLLNLFDLRPGRAIKVAMLAGGLLAPWHHGRTAAAAPLAAAAALLPEDLGERAMLGDAGANALGAMLGAAAASALPRPARLGVLAVVVGLTAASEKVSFTQVIERTGPLRRLDMLGRRPAPATTTPGPTAPLSTGPDSPPANGGMPSSADPADGMPDQRRRRSAEAR